MKVLVCGGRNYFDWKIFCIAMNDIDNSFHISKIIHGGANGADTMAGTWARKFNIPVKEYPADWKQYGKSAGAKRNTQMLVEGKPDLVVAFPGGPGTENMVNQTLRANIKLVTVIEEGEMTKENFYEL